MRNIRLIVSYSERAAVDDQEATPDRGCLSRQVPANIPSQIATLLSTLCCTVSVDGNSMHLSWRIPRSVVHYESLRGQHTQDHKATTMPISYLLSIAIDLQGFKMIKYPSIRSTSSIR
jgi:hypothetical protein